MSKNKALCDQSHLLPTMKTTLDHCTDDEFNIDQAVKDYHQDIKKFIKLHERKRK